MIMLAGSELARDEARLEEYGTAWRDCNSNPLLRDEWKTEMQVQIKAGCREFHAETTKESAIIGSVFLDGEDVTECCTAFYGCVEPHAHVYGWADLFVIAQRCSIGVTLAADENGKPIVTRRCGIIRWEKADGNHATNA